MSDARGLLRAVLAALAGAAAASVASAYNDDPAADQVFPAWRSTDATEPLHGFFAPAYVWHEVVPTGPHRAEVHFRNVSSSTWRFDFWLPGRQRPGDNAPVTLPPHLETREEVRVPIVLRHGRPGLTSERVRVYAVRRGDDTGPGRGAAPADEPAALDPAPWRPVRPLVADVVVARSNLLARVTLDAGGATVALRNPSVRDLHATVSVPALGVRAGDVPRVRVPAHGEAAVAALPRARPAHPAELAVVVVQDVRVGEESGPTYAADPGRDAGWYPVATADGSQPLPRERLLATVDDAGGGRARVRFRSRLRSDVRLRIALPGYQAAGRENPEAVVPAGGASEIVVELDRAADARLPVARIRAYEVRHDDGE